jgi:Thymidylate kinase
MRKHIIAVYGGENVGKTTTIKKVYLLLREAYPDAYVTIFPGSNEDPAEKTCDIYVIMYINGTFIGIASQGDPQCDLHGKLEAFRTHRPPCGVIVCATRTKGKTTVGAVDEMESEYGYSVDWVEKPRDKRNRDKKNDEFASDIVEQIKQLLSGKETL